MDDREVEAAHRWGLGAGGELSAFPYLPVDRTIFCERLHRR